MFLSLLDLKSLVVKLDDARRESTAGRGHYCDEPIVIDGSDHRLVPKPGAAKHRLERHGHDVVVGANGELYVKVPHGKHGRGNLVIDPTTGDITCGHCLAGVTINGT